MSIKIGDGYGGRSYSYGYGNGNRETKYSKKLDELLKTTPNKTGNPGLSLFQIVGAGLHPFKLIVPIGKSGDAIWKKIKDKIGFKDDHTDKNYQR